MRKGVVEKEDMRTANWCFRLAFKLEIPALSIISADRISLLSRVIIRNARFCSFCNLSDKPEHFRDNPKLASNNQIVVELLIDIL